MTTATTMQGDRPRDRDRITHSWRCSRHHPILETTKRDRAGRVWVVLRCSGCGETDLPARERDRAKEATDRNELEERKRTRLDRTDPPPEAA